MDTFLFCLYFSFLVFFLMVRLMIVHFVLSFMHRRDQDSFLPTWLFRYSHPPLSVRLWCSLMHVYRLILGVLSLYYSPAYFWRQSLPVNQSLLFQQAWLAIKALGSACLYSSGTADVHFNPASVEVHSNYFTH